LTVERNPSGLRAAGRRLWRDVTETLALDEHEKALLLEAARTADALDELEKVIRRDGVLVSGRPHPALVEARQQRMTLARLVASLRLPEDLQLGRERPQRRGAARGTYQATGLRAVQ
jgi:hypothetical protein